MVAERFQRHRLMVCKKTYTFPLSVLSVSLPISNTAENKNNNFILLASVCEYVCICVCTHVCICACVHVINFVWNIFGIIVGIDWLINEDQKANDFHKKERLCS